MSKRIHPICIAKAKGQMIVCSFLFGGTKLFDLKKYLKSQNKSFVQSMLTNVEADEYQNVLKLGDGTTIPGEYIYDHSKDYDIQAETRKENKQIEKTIYDFLKDIRKKEKMTQQELAKKSNLKQSAIARLEAGTNDIQLSTLESYLKPLGYKLEIIKQK